MRRRAQQHQSVVRRERLLYVEPNMEVQLHIQLGIRMGMWEHVLLQRLVLNTKFIVLGVGHFLRQNSEPVR